MGRFLHVRLHKQNWLTLYFCQFNMANYKLIVIIDCELYALYFKKFNETLHDIIFSQDFVKLKLYGKLVTQISYLHRNLSEFCF